MRGIGVAVITSTSGSLPMPLQHRALLDAEPVLLVDDDEAELRERRVAVEQRVRADDDVDVAASSPAAMRRRSAAFVRFVSSATPTGRSSSSDAGLGTRQPVEVLARDGGELLGEHLGRRHRARPGSRPAPR